MADSLRVAVITPERVIFEGDATQVVAPAWDGQVGVLRGHSPMMTLLGRGELRVDTNAGSQTFTVNGGFMQVADDQVTVLTEGAAE